MKLTKKLNNWRKSNMSCNEVTAEQFFNENGEFKTKEEYLKSAEELYDQVSESVEALNEIPTYFETLINPEYAIDPEQALETCEFLERSIYISTEITEELATSVFEMIKFWNIVDSKEDIPKEERHPINIYINSPGGSLEGALSIIGAIDTSTTPVHTYTIGIGFSGGFLIGISGHKRYGYKNSCYCFHEGSIEESGGDMHKFFQRVDFIKRRIELLKKITIEKTKISESEYERHFKDDWFMDAEQALNYGVIDEIVGEIK